MIFLILITIILLTLVSAAPPMVIKLDNKKLYVDGKPFSIKGVNYSPAPIGTSPKWTDPWGDYYQPRFRNLWDRDFPLIKAMGANTLRIPGWNSQIDHGYFLDTAFEYGLKVIVNFNMNSATQASPYEKTDPFMNEFQRYINHPALLAWSFGNDLNAKSFGWVEKFNDVGQCKYNGNDFNADHIGCFNNPAKEGYCFVANACIYNQLLTWTNVAARAAKDMMLGSQRYVLQQQKDAIFAKQREIQMQKEQRERERQQRLQREAEEGKDDRKELKELENSRTSNDDKSINAQNPPIATTTTSQLIPHQFSDVDDVNPESLQMPDGLPHLIIVSFADADLIAQRLGTFEKSAPDVDVWGVSSYRNNQFRWSEDSSSLIEEWQTHKVKKPLLITEFGVDAYNDQCGRTDKRVCFNTLSSDEATSGGVDESSQSDWIVSLINEISKADSSRNAHGVVLGGLVQEFSDQWWRSSSDVSGCWGPVPAHQPGFDAMQCAWKAHVDCPNLNLWNHGLCGYFTPSSFDQYANVAWFGLFAVQPSSGQDILVPRRAYGALQYHWAGGNYWWILLWIALVIGFTFVTLKVFRTWWFIHTGEELGQLQFSDWRQVRSILTDGLKMTERRDKHRKFMDLTTPRYNNEQENVSDRTPLLIERNQ